MAKYLAYYLILGLLFNSCASENTMILQNQQTSKTISQDEMKLSKEIFILIGHGDCCSGHIISINKNGEIKYSIGSYTIPNDKEDMPEIYDPEQITVDTEYKPKNLKLSQHKINSLEKLIRNGDELRFKEDGVSIDDYTYNIYLDNRKIATGYNRNIDEFPKNLKALIDFIHKEVEMYELPGMA